MTLIKSELVSQLTEQLPNLAEKTINDGVNLIIDQMSAALANGGRVEIRGFGSFSLHYHAPRKAHNPRTGEHVQTMGKNLPHFKPGKKLRLAVDQSKSNYTIVAESHATPDDLT